MTRRATPDAPTLRSSVGRKALVALSGLALIGFVIGHLAGNLTIFLGPDAINAYAAKLRHLGPILWVARIGLIGAAVIHIVTSIQLRRENRRARGRPYAVYRPVVTTMAARTMALSGLMVLAFIIYHLLHFTFRVTHPAISNAHDALGRHDVYRMVVLSFREWPITMAYIGAVGLLFQHLSHGIGSTAQSLGLNDARTMPLAQGAGRALAWVLFLGYISIPLSIAVGLIPSPPPLP